MDHVARRRRADGFSSGRSSYGAHQGKAVVEHLRELGRAAALISETA
ncbi:hypothetical protein AB0H77_06860 [Streptomyces sp. NPDC050844]